MKKYHSLLHVSVITENILITIRFTATIFFLLPTALSWHTDSMYIVTIQICRNLNEQYHYLISTTFVIWHYKRKLLSIPVAEYASFSHQARTLKTNLLGLISNFSRYYFKTATVCLLSSSSHVFTALGFASNHFGVLLWKIVKPCDHNEIKPAIGKVFRKYKS